MNYAIAWPAEASLNPTEMLETVALPSEKDKTAKKLSGSASDLLRSVVTIIDEMVVSALEKRTAEEFVKTRDQLFPQYLSAMAALSVLIKVSVPKQTMDRIVAESLSEQEADFRDHGAAAFGHELTERGRFTVWTLRKISDLAEKVREAEARNGDSEEIAKKFVASVVWARFHLDCLLKSIHAKKPIFPDVVDPLADGLRAAVNAYAHIRQLVDVQEPDPAFFVTWDAEDEAWLADSMSDLSK